MRILVTGASGSLAQHLIPLLLEDGHEVIGVSRDEFKQSLIASHDRLKLYLCDVRDRDRLLEASRHVDLVFHLAAMKRIECCEEQPEEAISVNVLGTQNLLFCQRMNRIPRVVLISTDKACLPITEYGYTKALAESLVLRNPQNQVVRYGNVLASRGSVVPLFVAQIKRDNEIQVTDRRCSRFWWTLPQAATYVYLSSKREFGGLCIPDLKAAPVVSVGKTLAKILKRPEPRIREVGLRSKEKIHEDMRTEEEGGRLVSSDESRWFKKQELEEILLDAVGDFL